MHDAPADHNSTFCPYSLITGKISLTLRCKKHSRRHLYLVGFPNYQTSIICIDISPFLTFSFNSSILYLVKKMINEQKIRLFLSLANTLSFTETANQLFITQQAVSKHISQLEDDLGYPLFVRSKRSVKLTPAGERSRRFFQDELVRITEFIADERDAHARLSRSIRIGYNNWLNCGYAISSARIRFHAMYPDIAHVPERQPPDLLQQKLRTGELDIILVLRRFILNEMGLKITDLTDFPLSIIANRDLLAAGEENDTSFLSSFPLIINSFSDETSSETICLGSRPQPQLRASSP